MNDAAVRKQWLFLLILFPTLNILYFAITGPVHSDMANLPAWFNIVFLAYSTLSPILFNYIIYRCAYRKPGTKLLTFLMITGPIAWLAGTVGYLFGRIPPPPNAFYWPYMILCQILSVWWFILCWKMRKINKKLQLEAVAEGSSS